MKHTVQVTFNADLTQKEIENLGQLFRDAMGEFIARRTPAEQYVAARYEEQSFNFKQRKVHEVLERLDMAVTIKHALADLSTKLVE